jgi:hypothetical protein
LAGLKKRKRKFLFPLDRIKPQRIVRVSDATETSDTLLPGETTMPTETRLMFPNLTDANGYRRVLLTMDNTIAHEPLMVQTRYGRKINGRRQDLEIRRTATLAEGIARFGREAFLPLQAFCSKCGKELRNKFTGPKSGPLYAGCENFDPAIHCHCGKCS